MRPLSQMKPGVPDALDDIVRKGLARNPDDRYSTALEMAEDLSAAMAPASQLTVARWVQEVAGKELAERHRLLEEIEAELYSDLEELKTSVNRALDEGELPSATTASLFPIRPAGETESSRGKSERKAPSRQPEKESAAASEPGARKKRSAAMWTWAAVILVVLGLFAAYLAHAESPQSRQLGTGLVPDDGPSAQQASTPSASDSIPKSEAKAALPSGIPSAQAAPTASASQRPLQR